jgi:ankyrin repeat protein
LDDIKKLVENGADINRTYNLQSLGYHDENFTPLQLVIREGYAGRKNVPQDTDKYFEIVKYLVEQGADVNKKIDENTTLLNIVAINNFKIIKYLINNGADVNTNLIFNANNELPRMEGYYEKIMKPIHCAIEAGDFEAVKDFIKRGADVNALDSYGQNVLHYAAAKSNLEMLKYLKELTKEQQNQKPIIFAALRSTVRGNNNAEVIKVVKYIIEELGEDVNAKTKEEGITPLHSAIHTGIFEVIKYLVEKGADVNAKAGNRAILNYGPVKLEILKYLVEHGADIKAADKNQSLLSMYCGSQIYKINAGEDIDIDVLYYLVENGADVKPSFYCYYDKNTSFLPSLLQYKNVDLDIVKFFVERGADVNAKNENGDAAIHIAIQKQKYDVLKYLVNCGADINVTSKNGNTILHDAARAPNDILKFLIEKNKNKNININAQNNVGVTPLDIANYEDKENNLNKCNENYNTLKNAGAKLAKNLK